MAGIIGEGVSLRGFYDDKWSLTWNLSGAASRADVGKLVSQDTTLKNTAKLSGDTNAPMGVLLSYEDRTKTEGIIVGAVAHKGAYAIAYTGALALGDCVIGSATPGVGKTAAAGTNNTRVVEIMAGNIAVVLFL